MGKFNRFSIELMSVEINDIFKWKHEIINELDKNFH